MTTEEIAIHKDLKRKNISYPTLPKVITSQSKKYKLLSENAGYVRSVMTGFNNRLSNFNRMNR